MMQKRVNAATARMRRALHEGPTGTSTHSEEDLVALEVELTTLSPEQTADERPAQRQRVEEQLPTFRGRPVAGASLWLKAPVAAPLCLAAVRASGGVGEDEEARIKAKMHAALFVSVAPSDELYDQGKGSLAHYFGLHNNHTNGQVVALHAQAASPLESEAAMVAHINIVVSAWWLLAIRATKTSDFLLLRELGREYKDEVGEVGVKLRARRLTEVGTDTQQRYERVLARMVLFICRAAFNEGDAPRSNSLLALRNAIVHGGTSSDSQGIIVDNAFSLLIALKDIISAQTYNNASSCTILAFISAASLHVPELGAMPMACSTTKTREICAALLYVLRLTIITSIANHLPLDEDLKRGKLGDNDTFRATITLNCVFTH